MGHILNITDLHCHEHQAFSKATAFGYNSRLYWTLKVLEDLATDARNNDCSSIVIIGDLFHSRGKISVITYNEVFERLLKLSKEFHLYLLTGNHDCALKDTAHALQPFRMLPNTTIIDTPTLLTIEGLKCYFIPFIAEQSELQQAINNAPSCDVLYGHFTTNTAIAPKTLTPVNIEEGGNINDKFINSDTIVLLGHFHNYHKIDRKAQNSREDRISTKDVKQCYLGSPIQHNFGDSEDRKYSAVLNTDTKTLTLLELTDRYPRFRELRITDSTLEKLDELKKDWKAWDYIKVINQVKDLNIQQVQQLVPEDSVYENQVAATACTRLEVAADSNITDIIKAYVETVAPETLEQSILLETGIALLEEAGRE